MDHKLVTVTLNTALDQLIEVARLEPGTVMRATRCGTIPAGKGINVARAAGELGERALVLGFAGRDSVAVFDELRSPTVDVRLLGVDGETRRNVTLFDAMTRLETHFQTTGYGVTASDLESLRLRVKDSVVAGDVVVIAGSLPDGTPVRTYETLVELCRALGAIVILDVSGESLCRGVRARPTMIKPNLEELSELLRYTPENSAAAIADHALRMTRQGVDTVVVSRGSEGVVVAQAKSGRAWTASVDNRRSERTAGVGCGDALVAGFACAYLRGYPVTAAIRLGVACATANLATTVPGLCRASDVAALCEQVIVARIR